MRQIRDHACQNKVKNKSKKKKVKKAAKQHENNRKVVEKKYMASALYGKRSEIGVLYTGF